MKTRRRRPRRSKQTYTRKGVTRTVTRVRLFRGVYLYWTAEAKGQD